MSASSLVIDREHVIVVHLRPHPGEPAPDPVVIGTSFGLEVNIGSVGELIFKQNSYKRNTPFSTLVRVFAPHAWLYYEYREKEQP